MRQEGAQVINEGHSMRYILKIVESNNNNTIPPVRGKNAELYNTGINPVLGT